MPDEAAWRGFFDPGHVLDRLDLDAVGDVVDFGCGYGLFTIEAARRSHGIVHAFDIDAAMVAATTRAARHAGLTGVRAAVRDFLAHGTGLAAESCDYAMLFNLLHVHDPVGLLREAWRVVRRGGRLGIIHWNADPATPRGPSLEIRPTAARCRAWAEEAGFEHLRDEPGIARWHWGLLMNRPEGDPANRLP